MMLSLRPSQAADFAAIARIFHTAIHQTARSYYTEQQLQAWSQEERPPEHWRMRTRNLTVYVAVVDDVVGGFVGFAPSGHIDLLFTRPDLARQGIGRASLTEAERNLVTGGATTAWADVSLEAQTFFSAMGYQIEREQTVFCREVPIQNLLMKKTLTSSPGSTGAEDGLTIAPVRR